MLGLHDDKIAYPDGRNQFALNNIGILCGLIENDTILGIYS